MKGIDCSTKITAATANALVAQGIKFVCRYLVPDRYPSKRLTKEEAEIISRAGLQLISIFETTANRVQGGAQAGTTDGQLALAEAKAIGQLTGSVIYFAVDYDAQVKDYDTIEAYLRHAFAEISGYACGVYGSYYIVEEMARRCACTYFWQTYAWSGGKKSVLANIYQNKNGVSMAGIQVDINESYDNEGFWRLSALKSNVPTVTIKPGMVSDEVKILQAQLNKYGYKLAVDGNFGKITEAAVKDFQRTKGLTIDGIVGLKTWSALFSG